MFDFSGLAALIAIPASVFAAVWSARRTRGLEDRIERLIDLIERMPPETAEREALERARDEMALRLVIRLSNLRLTPLFGLFTLSGVYLGGALLWRAIDPKASDQPIWEVIFWLGLVIFVISIALSLLYLWGRDRHVSRVRRELKERRDYWGLSKGDRRKADRRAAADKQQESATNEARQPTTKPTHGARRRSASST